MFASTELLRGGLEELFTHTAGVTDVTIARTMTELVDRCRNERPDVAVLEVDATGNPAGDAIAEIRHALPAARLIGMCTCLRGASEVRELLAVGLDDVASIRHGEATLLQQLLPDDARTDIGGGLSLHDSSAPTPTTRRARTSTLTPREVDVLTHVSAGLTAAQIAARLGVSHKTVENHKQRIYSKLDVHSQTHAVSVAFRRGLLEGSHADVTQAGRIRPSA